MRALIEDIRVAIPAAFESDDYRNQLRAIEEETEKAVEAHWKSLEAEAAKQGIGVICGEGGCYNQTPRDVCMSWHRDFLDILKGHGIGLAVVKDIARSYGGRLSIQKSELGGAEIMVSIPPLSAAS